MTLQFGDGMYKAPDIAMPWQSTLGRSFGVSMGHVSGMHVCTRQKQQRLSIFQNIRAQAACTVFFTLYCWCNVLMVAQSMG